MRSSIARSFSTTTTPGHMHGSVRGPHGSYAEEYALSLNEPEKFWMRAADKLDWFRKPTIAFEQDAANPFLTNWFCDGLVNTCYNCLDVHCRGDEKDRSDQVAVYYDSPVTGVKRQFTYRELLDKVSK